MGEGGVGGRSDANNWRVGWGIYLAVPPPHTLNADLKWGKFASLDVSSRDVQQME